MIFFRTCKYLKYILLARHRKGHGIHSPFVFDLVSRVFRNKLDPSVVCIIEKIRDNLKSDHAIVSVKDLGSGSVRIKIGKRKVSEIAKYSPVTEKYGVLLANISAEFGNKLIIEFGTSLGISAMYMAAASPYSVLTTMEGCPAISELARKNFIKAGINNIELLTGSFEENLPLIKRKNIKPGLVFIDGNHRKEPVLKYFAEITSMSDSNTVVVIDDIHISQEMEEAWTQIKTERNISLTIDIFRMGIVFFRQGLTRADYIIRY